MLTLIHYGELALKGNNRRYFETRLMENIRRATGGKVRRLEGRMTLEGGDVDALRNVFGIAWYAPAWKAEKRLESITKVVLGEVGKRIEGNPTFGIFVKRADKDFPYDSMEIARMVGQEVVDECGLEVDLDSPDLPVYIEIADEVFLHFKRTQGLRGMPVGVGGRVLSLLSGGIDSPVSSYLMMKRGCEVDFIHFHVFLDNETAFNTKMSGIVRALNRYQSDNRLFLVPYKTFQISILEESVYGGYELVLFRRFMARVAERMGQQSGCEALVTGDSLGQVASQTLQNLRAFSTSISLPLFQPLIGFDKQEIVDLAKQIGTYEISIEPYKDCCSILAPSPNTRADLDRVRELEGRIGMDSVVEETLRLADSYEM